MIPTCPTCESDEVRLSRRKSALRRVLGIFGFYDFRCDDCGHRFQSNIFSLRDIPYAKCPCCHRMDLSRWTREYYNPSSTTRMMLSFGAKAVRCVYCRHNFWSFRFIREKFSMQKRFARSQVVVPVPPLKAPDSAARESALVHEPAQPDIIYQTEHHKHA